MNYCKIENGVVTNVSHWESPMPAGWADPADTWVQSDVAGPGWTYANGVFTAPVVPPPPPPSTNPADYTISRRQIFRGLIVAGVTTDPDTFMRTILGAIADPTVRALALADWINEPAAGYHRTDPLFNEADLLAAAHMTAAQVDQLWLLSAQQGA
jgi:hypothetical protein